jgi:predicted RNA binding protein YcfA (HicA-like mRNA interferase family)
MKRVFKIKEIIAILISQGWYLATVDGKLSQDVNPFNLKSMERQAGLKFSDFVN